MHIIITALFIYIKLIIREWVLKELLQRAVNLVANAKNKINKARKRKKSGMQTKQVKTINIIKN